MVYGAEWPLSGQTKISADARAGSPVGPVINAAELMMVVPLGGRTHPRDVIGMEELARGFVNPSPDWSGDSCLSLGNSWTGVSCTQEPLARVTALATTLDQDIENLQKKLGGCLRENRNLQEEVEAYRVKSHLADLYGAELSKESNTCAVVTSPVSAYVSQAIEGPKPQVKLF